MHGRVFVMRSYVYKFQRLGERIFDEVQQLVLLNRLVSCICILANNELLLSFPFSNYSIGKRTPTIKIDT